MFVDAEPEAPPLLPEEFTEDSEDTNSEDFEVPEPSEQPSPRGERSQPASDKTLRAEKRRQEIINEIVTTERDYVRDLNITINVITPPHTTPHTASHHITTTHRTTPTTRQQITIYYTTLHHTNHTSPHSPHYTTITHNFNTIK